MAPSRVKGKRRVIKKQMKCSSIDVDGDIISNLPPEVIDNILICLPIQDAARTSILARQWRFKWLSIPQLVFDEDINELFRSVSRASRNKIWFWIFQILLLHRGPLHKLHLSVNEELDETSTLLNQIILFVTTKDIREFTLYPPNMDTDTDTNRIYTLPSTFFLCTHLTHLNLVHCVFRLPPHYTGLSKLTSVNLSVRITADDFKTFVSKSPLLQRLKLCTCWGGDHIVIDAPKLKFFYFDCPHMSFSFKNVPVLSVVIIKRSARLIGPQSGYIVNVFGSIPSIEYFSAGPRILLDLTMEIVVERLPIMLKNLKCVELRGLHFNSSKEVQFALLVIRSSPRLHKLKMQLLEYENDVDNVPVHSLCVSEDSVKQLCEVVMEDFSGTLRELEFIEFLLAKPFELKKIIIQPPEDTTDKELVEIMKAVNRFQRASPNTQVIFIDNVKVAEVNGGTSRSVFKLEEFLA